MNANMMRGDEHNLTPFECHLTKEDLVSKVGNMDGLANGKLGNFSHVGFPIWHEVSNESLKVKHSMDEMVKNIQIFAKSSYNPLYEIITNPAYNGGADQENPLHNGTGSSSGTSVRDSQTKSFKLDESFKFNELEEGDGMDSKKYKRMLRNREIVKKKFQDYIVNEDGYNNLGYRGYQYI